jgi:hypothetical protein
VHLLKLGARRCLPLSHSPYLACFKRKLCSVLLFYVKWIITFNEFCTLQRGTAQEQRHQRLRKCSFHRPGDPTLLQIPRG